MPETRVIDIAKSQGMSAAHVLMRLRDAGFDVTAAAFTVDEGSALRRPPAGNGTAFHPAPPLPRAARPRAPAPAPRSSPPPSAQPAQRASQGPADSPRGVQSPRPLFEPDGPPLQMRPRRREEEPPTPSSRCPRVPTGTRPPVRAAARGGQPKRGRGCRATRPAPRTGPTIVEDAKVRPAPTPPPPLRRAAPAQPAQPAAGGR